ncbi:Uncharacterized homolog of phage Mu protein gp47 [Morganella morganii]|nr:Uncharacterized homolog of phage Mu protein gp47 [Morganella morganii]
MAEYNYITSSGVIIPDTAEQRTAVENEFKAVFGQDLDISPETPQGVLITMETENRDAIVRNNAELANQINPDLAGGVFLDAIWALMGGERRDATRSILTQVQFGGVPGTIIPKGAQAETLAGDTFFTTKSLIIGKNGTVSGDMRAVETGPVECPAGQMMTVASSVLGWETVTNPTGAVTGRIAESDLQSRRRRKLTLAKNTVSVGEAMTSALYELEGVRSLVYRENYTNTPMAADGITLVPHSVYVCVEGGESQEIAAALLRTKTIGAAYNGSEEVEVTEPVSGQVYTVKFGSRQRSGAVLSCDGQKNFSGCTNPYPGSGGSLGKRGYRRGWRAWWPGGKFHRLRFLSVLMPLSRGCLSPVLNYPQTAHTGHRIFIR